MDYISIPRIDGILESFLNVELHAETLILSRPDLFQAGDHGVFKFFCWTVQSFQCYLKSFPLFTYFCFGLSLTSFIEYHKD